MAYDKRIQAHYIRIGLLIFIWYTSDLRHWSAREDIYRDSWPSRLHVKRAKESK